MSYNPDTHRGSALYPAYVDYNTSQGVPHYISSAPVCKYWNINQGVGNILQEVNTFGQPCQEPKQRTHIRDGVNTRPQEQCSGGCPYRGGPFGNYMSGVGL